jgi:two-component system, LytTR family, response regulator
MIRAIVIDDEPSACQVVQHHAGKVPFLDLQATFHSPAEAMAYLLNNNIDLVFLDIQMPDMLGTELAQWLKQRNIAVIFCTAYADYALDGFAVQAIDYLLKPIEFSRFLGACSRAKELLQAPKSGPASIFVKEGFDWVRVKLDEILYIQSDTNLLFIHERQRRITTRMTLSEMLGQLPEGLFCRVHKSYIVALAAIQKLERQQINVGNKEIPLASSYREELEKRLLGTTKR